MTYPLCPSAEFLKDTVSWFVVRLLVAEAKGKILPVDCCRLALYLPKKVCVDENFKLSCAVKPLKQYRQSTACMQGMQNNVCSR